MGSALRANLVELGGKRIDSYAEFDGWLAGYVGYGKVLITRVVITRWAG